MGTIDIRRRRFNIVTTYDGLTTSKYGWTYVFINNERTMLKIGKTTSNFDERQAYSKTYMPYGALDLSLYFAIDDERIEELLHSYFSEYHANYLIRYDHNLTDILRYKSPECYFTKSEAIKFSVSKGIENLKIFFTKTKIELFKFPLPINRKRTLNKLIGDLVTNGFHTKKV